MIQPKTEASEPFRGYPKPYHPIAPHSFSQTYVNNHEMDQIPQYIFEQRVKYVNMYLKNDIEDSRKEVVQDSNDLVKDIMILYIS